jgi:hypothetical protein
LAARLRERNAGVMPFVEATGALTGREAPD